ncbi:lipopolysaccharide assembly protein LapB [Fibrobacter sp. UWH1]|uniref:tetratricopeptide repeat protein n=1 Tax=Fibrobacter sp. UWH1 TaxID=1964354 RepID=UPI000B523905|nr:tetratricopeptide repeat protein [Fibrobacter sp. UWH1]OWV12808.1 hypothetical protein B7992_08970 [Fibrobacter sp. UWH1]
MLGRVHKNAGWVSAVLAMVALYLAACVDDYVARGNAALRIGDFERAISNFSKALDEDPANRDARYGLALSYYTTAEDGERLRLPSFDLWSRAAREFKILSRVDSSGRINANYSTCLFYLARATLAQNEGANVLPLLDQSIQLDSVNYFSYNLKGLILSHRGRGNDLEQAKKIFIHIVTHDPDFISAYVNLGNVYWEEGDVESAWDIWSMGLEKAPDHEDLLRWTRVAEDSLKAMVLSGEL